MLNPWSLPGGGEENIENISWKLSQWQVFRSKNSQNMLKMWKYVSIVK